MDKFCENCGNELNPEADYCLKCGKRINKITKKQKFDPELNDLGDGKPKEIFKNIIIFILLVIAYLFVPQIIASILYYDMHLSENIATLIGNLSFVGILIGYFYKMFKEKIKDYINNFSSYFGFTMKYWGIGLLIMFVSNLFMAYVVFPDQIAANEEINRAFIKDSPLIGFLLVAFLAPFVEEMIFRFGLRKITGRNKFFPWISALAFGFPHVIAGMTLSLSVSNLLQLLYVIPYGALGWAFGHVYNKTDNIFCSMTAHCIHNFMCFIIIMFAV